MSMIKELINKGVPISTPVPILANELIRNSNNEEETRHILHNKFDNYLRGLFAYGYDSFDVMMTLTIQSDYDSLEKKICFSDIGFFNSLLLNLNVDNVCKANYKDSHEKIDFESYEEAVEKMHSQIKKLKLIRNERQLKKKFPILYNKYMSEKEKMNSFRQIIQIYNSYNEIERKKMSVLLLSKYSMSINDILNNRKK